MEPDTNATEKMRIKSSTSLILAVLAGVILGGLLGYYLPDTMLSLSFVGQLFLNALHIVVIPVIIASVIVGVAALADLGRVNRATGKTLLYFGVTSAIAVIIGYALTAIIRPGVGANTAGAEAPYEITQVTSFSFSELLSSVLPENFFLATAQGQLLGIVIFSLFFGVALIPLGDRGKAVVGFFQGVNDVIMRVVQLLVVAAPLGLLSLVATAVAHSTEAPTGLIASVGTFSLTVLVGFLIQGLIVLPLALKFLANRPFWKYLMDTSPALVTAFGTGSAVATLPLTYNRVVEKGDVDERAGALTLPLGAMINMNGTALYLVIGTLFCAQAFAVDLSWLQILTVLGVTFLLSIGASLVPHGSLLILGIVLFSAGFPAQAIGAIGLIAIVDWFFERLRATLNVWGDIVGAAVIGETFEFKTARRVKPAISSRPSGSFRRSNGTKRHDRKSSSTERKRQDKQGHQPQRDSRKRDGHKDRKRRGNGRPDGRVRGRRHEGRKPAAGDKKLSSGKPGSFQISKPPYHVLDTELRGKKTAETDIRTEQPAAGETTFTRAQLSPETIERERAKIAAQLAELRQREGRSESDTAGDQGSDVERVPDESPDVRVSETSEEKYPRVDFYSDDVPGGSTQEADGNTRSEAEEPQEKVSESTEVPSYGRGKSRRGPAVKTGTSSKEETEPQEESKPEFSAENISFGRTKRKKPSS
ncbi:MAG: cation:dicarboxylase symporter family transporter [Candidatus Zixiibacteriota bacterium]|nr:MAG: cation:dicarboxylase symporter family transporter [candidate division Zixibacteria bacterium]